MSRTNNSLQKGVSLDNYTIDSVLGGGGFSIVYLARSEERRVGKDGRNVRMSDLNTIECDNTG